MSYSGKVYRDGQEFSGPFSKRVRYTKLEESVPGGRGAYKSGQKGGMNYGKDDMGQDPLHGPRNDYEGEGQ